MWGVIRRYSGGGDCVITCDRVSWHAFFFRDISRKTSSDAAEVKLELHTLALLSVGVTVGFQNVCDGERIVVKAVTKVMTETRILDNRIH